MKPTARNDAYTGLLFALLLALVVGCALLALDYRDYGKRTPPTLIIPSTN